MINYEYKPEYVPDKYNPLTLQKIVGELATCLGEDKEDFVTLISAIARSCKLINYHLRQAGLSNLLGYEETEETNSSGEKRKKIDVISNDILKQQLLALPCVAATASEEDDNMQQGNPKGKFLVAFDPLDGSSNIDCNVTVGTIFAIWKRDPSKGTATQEEFFVKGREIICSGYCVYGSSTLFMLAVNGEVNGFTQGDNLGDFVLTHPKVRTKDTFNVYSVNEGNESKWYKPIREYVKDKKNPPKGKSAYSLRYIGSMVGDVHRTLLYGGTFMYPADTSSKKGKLRFLYECIPLAHLIECAGGVAHDGEHDILDLVPTDIHERTGIILGSKHDVEEIREYHKKFGSKSVE